MPFFYKIGFYPIKSGGHGKLCPLFVFLILTHVYTKYLHKSLEKFCETNQKSVQKLFRFRTLFIFPIF